MNSKRRQLPLEVSSWMDKDLTLRKISANSRLLTNDTRQNIVLSRHFYADLLTLSFARYRKMTEHDFDKRVFLRNQQKKSDTSMPGLRPYVDHLTYDMNRPATSRTQSRRGGDHTFLSPSNQSIFSRPGTKSDPTFNRRQQSSIRQIQTAKMRKSRPEITTIDQPTTTTNQRPPTGRQMSRETLNRLAQPKGHRFKSAPSSYVRSNPSDGAETVEEILAKIDQTSNVISSPMQDILPRKPKTTINDQRFHHLMGAFAPVHTPETSNSHTFRSIVEANTSLQDEEGQWKTEHPSVSSRKTELKHHRQMLANQFHNRFDIFLVDIGA